MDLFLKPIYPFTTFKEILDYKYPRPQSDRTLRQVIMRRAHPNTRSLKFKLDIPELLRNLPHYLAIDRQTQKRLHYEGVFKEDWMCMFVGYMDELGDTALRCINIMEYDENGTFLHIWPGKVTDDEYVVESEEEP